MNADESPLTDLQIRYTRLTRDFELLNGVVVDHARALEVWTRTCRELHDRVARLEARMGGDDPSAVLDPTGDGPEPPEYGED